eukprot:1156436-Pelagomonas_calceolata.AAC.3
MVQNVEQLLSIASVLGTAISLCMRRKSQDMQRDAQTALSVARTSSSTFLRASMRLQQTRIHISLLISSGNAFQPTAVNVHLHQPLHQHPGSGNAFQSAAVDMHSRQPLHQHPCSGDAFQSAAVDMHSHQPQREVQFTIAKTRCIEAPAERIIRLPSKSGWQSEVWRHPLCDSPLNLKHPIACSLTSTESAIHARACLQKPGHACRSQGMPAGATACLQEPHMSGNQATLLRRQTRHTGTRGGVEVSRCRCGAVSETDGSGTSEGVEGFMCGSGATGKSGGRHTAKGTSEARHTGISGGTSTVKRTPTAVEVWRH